MFWIACAAGLGGFALIWLGSYAEDHAHDVWSRVPERLYFVGGLLLLGCFVAICQAGLNPDAVSEMGGCPPNTC